MKRDDIIKILSSHRQELAGFGISALSIFGSAARDEAQPDSDIDLLVEFSAPVGLFEFVRLKGYLETLLGHSVDLVTPDALRERMREEVLKEAVRAA